MKSNPINEPPPDFAASQTARLSEIQEDLEIRLQRQRLFPRAALVGLGAGLIIAVLFRSALDRADTLRNALVDWSLGLVFSKCDRRRAIAIRVGPVGPFCDHGNSAFVFAPFSPDDLQLRDGNIGWYLFPLACAWRSLGIIDRPDRPPLCAGIVSEPGAFAVVGMAAYFAAIVRAPLTGVVLIVEMTGDYQQMLPLLISCFCAYAVTEFLKDSPIYEALLERDLVFDGSNISIKEPMVIDFEIEQDAPFSGQEVRMLGFPPAV